MRILDTAAEKIGNSFLGYLHLWSWADQEITILLSGRPLRRFSSIRDFWGAVYNDEIQTGAQVEFQSAFVTEWIPRLPGMVWKQELNYAPATRRYRSVQMLAGMQASLDALNGGLGVAKLTPSPEREDYVALSLTTADAWLVDRGVPLIVSSSVYDAFLARRVRNNAVEADLRAIVQLGVPPLVNSPLWGAIGKSLDPDFLSSLTIPRGIPYIYLRLHSPLHVRFRSNNSHPPGFLWAVVRITHNAKVTHYVDEGTQGRIEVVPVDQFQSYSFLAGRRNVNIPDDVDACAALFAEGKVIDQYGDTKLPLGLPLGIESVEVLTEFDTRARRFSSAVPLKPRAWENPNSLAEIKRVLIDLNRADRERAGNT